MSDSLGGTVIIVLIVLFITIVSGYLAFNVNYTKAFKMKNKIIDTYEKYKGNCDGDNDCNKEIDEYAEEIGYNTDSIKCENKTTGDISTQGLRGEKGKYCFLMFNVDETSDDKDIINDSCKNGKVYFKIITKAETPKIPIFYYFFKDLGYFTVTGNTKSFCYKGE